MFLLCACFNPCVEERRSGPNVYLGCEPIAFGSLVTVESMFAAMLPGNAAIVQYNSPRNEMGHYVHLWQQRNDQNELWYFYYNSIGNVKLHCGRNVTQLASDIERNAGQYTARIFDGTYNRKMFIFSLPLELNERKEAVLRALRNLCDHSNRVIKAYLKLDQFSDILFPHNFFPAFLQGAYGWKLK